MTAVEQWTGEQQPRPVGVRTLVEWAQEADAAYQLASKLAQTVFCPEQFRGQPGNATAAILAGSELGMSPLASLSSFDVIQGRATARAITQRALVQSRGHEVVLLESTDSRCRMKGRRAGSQEWQTVTWTIDRARNLGLVGKSNWKSQPGTMLLARCSSELCRLIAADAILGLGGGYSTEEVADGHGPERVEVAPAESGRRKMRLKPAEDPAPEAAADPPAAAEGVPSREDIESSWADDADKGDS